MEGGRLERRFGLPDSRGMGVGEAQKRMLVREIGGNMRGHFFAALTAVGAFGFAQTAYADQTFSFWLNGDGSVSAHGTITIAPDSNANPLWGTSPPATVSPTPPMYQGAYDPPNAWSIVSVTGVFSDAHLGLENLP